MMTRHFTHSRRYAETAVETALLVCEAGAATEGQLADLSDAIKALHALQYQVAAILAEAAIEGRSKIRTAVRPAGLAHSVAELGSMLGEYVPYQPGSGLPT